jgi:hypothetical protein
MRARIYWISLSFCFGLYVSTSVGCGADTKSQFGLQGNQPIGYLGPPVEVPVAKARDSRSQTPYLAPTESAPITLLPNLRTNDKQDDAPDQSQSESSIVVDPTDHRRLVTGFNDCRGFGIPSRNGISGFSYSTDGGNTWTSPATGLPKAEADDFGTRGDPSLDVDSAGNIYYASLYQSGETNSLQLTVHKGHFEGSTLIWGPPTFPARPTVGSGVDKEHIGVDKRPGSQNVYVSYTNFSASGNGQVEVVRSVDGGATWSAPVIVAAASGTVHQGSIPRVGPDGELYVVWEDGFAQGTGRSMHVRKSTSWPTFGPDITIDTVTAVGNPPFNSRINEFPSLAIDHTSGPNRGHLYVVWNDGRFGGAAAISAIIMTHSPDGMTWSAPVMLNDDGQPASSGTYHWFPWAAVDGSGALVAGWYDRRLRGSDAAMTDVFATRFRISSGIDPNVRLTTQTFSMNVPARCTPNFGDYSGASASATEFHFSYGDGREGNPDNYHAGFLTGPLKAELGNSDSCRGTTTVGTVTVYGGTGLFQGDVTLSLSKVTPTPASGAITATFDPNPVPSPVATGTQSTLRITTTADASPGTYALTVQGTDGTTTAAADVALVVHAQAPGAPALIGPANGSDGISTAPTFSWSAAADASSYVLEISASSDCTGTPVQSISTTATSVALSSAQALDVFKTYSWRVKALNGCNQTASSCFSFRTLSCGGTHEAIADGDFEQGLDGWTVTSNVPPPEVSAEHPHGGSASVKLGVFNSGSNITLGDSAVSQTITLAAGTAPTLSFWKWPFTTDDITFDQQYVRITPIDPPGPSVDLMRECENDQTWVREEFSLAEFAGKTIQITFGVHNDFIFGTGMFIDDVSVSALSCGPPDFVLHVTPPEHPEVCAGASLVSTVAVESVNGPNFTSPVTLNAINLPPGTSVQFGKNPLNPGESTTMTLVTTTGGTPADVYSFDVTGVAVTPPPSGPRVVTETVRIDTNSPDAPELISPRPGELNLPRRPTLSWTAPFVPDFAARRNALRPQYPWQLAAARAPGQKAVPMAFGASRYHVEVARDSGFNDVVVQADVTDTVYTLAIDLDIGRQYFWRVTATNACGTSPASATGSFVVGACAEAWSAQPPVPNAQGPAQASAVTSPVTGKLYVLGRNNNFPSRDELWSYDPATAVWSRLADVPAPGAGNTFGSAVELGGKIYVFGGSVNGVAHRVLWRYDIASNSWSRGHDLPSDNFGAAVAAIGNQIYVAYGSGFVTQTWQYDPAADTFTRKADAPSVGFNNLRLHGVALGGELHAFAGGFNGAAHVIYNPASNTWRTGPALPFGVTDPAVGVLGGKAWVVGGTPTARTQIFDPVTSTWSQGPQITALTNGIDNTAGAVLGASFHVIGGLDSGSSSQTIHAELRACNAGELSSAMLLPFVVDGNGTVANIRNERTALILDNAIGGTPLSTTCLLYGENGALDSQATFALAPNELKSIPDIVRKLRGVSDVQNTVGSLVVFGTGIFHAMASVVNQSSTDPALEDGQPLAAATSGFIPAIEAQTYHTQAAFANPSSDTAFVQLIAYPTNGGTTPAKATLLTLAPHQVVSYLDIVSQLGLPDGHLGQLTWSSSQPLGVVARAISPDLAYGGFERVRVAGEATSTVVVPYVEDSATFSTELQLNNPGPITANVTLRFFDESDATGGAGGTAARRDLQVPVNSATSLANVVRWALHNSGTMPLGKRGFVVATTPQAITAQARIVDNETLDPAAVASGTVVNAFSPTLVRIEPPGDYFKRLAVDPMAAPLGNSRFAVANPGPTPAVVELAAVNASGGAPLAPLVVTVSPGGQFFTENLAQSMGLPPVFYGWVSVRASAPVSIYNHRRAGNTGSTVPIRAR